MAMSKEEAYSVFDLQFGASFEEVIKQYKFLALEWFPDRHSHSKISLEKFQKISQALLVLYFVDSPFRYTPPDRLLTEAEMLSLFQFVFFGNGNIPEDDDEYDDILDSSEEESFFLESDSDLSTRLDLNSEWGDNDKDVKDENKVSEQAKLEEAVQNAKELIQEEEREKKKAEKRKAQKKRRKERKKKEKSAQKNEGKMACTSYPAFRAKKPDSDFVRYQASSAALAHARTQESSEEKVQEVKQVQEPDSSESEENIDTTCAFVAEIAKKKVPNISVKKDDPKSVESKNEDESSSRVLRSRQLALRGNEMASLDHFQEAIQLFSEAIKLDPKDHRFYGNRSYCQERLANYDRALKDAEKSIQLAPQVPKGYFRKGKALNGLKRYTEAEKCFEMVLKLDPKCDDAVKELFLARIVQLTDMGFTREEAEEAVEEHGSVESALDSLLSCCSASSSRTRREEVFVSDDDDEDFQMPLAPLPSSRPKAAQEVDVKTDPNNPEGHNSIWVGNVQPTVTEKHLLSLFSKYGEIISIKVLSEKFCAFVNYKNKASAGMAMRALQGTEVGGENLYIRFPNSDPSKTATSKECFYWRTTGCAYGDGCRYKHVKEHKGIDKRKVPHRL